MARAAQLAKTLLHKFAPALAHAVAAFKLRRVFGAKSKSHRETARRELFNFEKPVVLSGPFAGMRYVDAFTIAPIAPRWLGVYEPQLHPWIAGLIAGTHDSFVNIGAGEGYYAVGVARARPGLKVASFETDPLSRATQRKLARSNQVANIAAGPYCDHRRLEAALGSLPFVLCDIEGGELALIDPARCPGLRRADMIVEIHASAGHAVAEVADIVAGRFAATHAAERLQDDDAARRTLLDGIRAGGVTTPMLEALAAEERSMQNIWLVLLRRNSASA